MKTYKSAPTKKGNVGVSIFSHADANAQAVRMDYLGCVNCQGCEGCNFCTGCVDCHGCYHSRECVGCTRCDRCKNCKSCNSCIDCTGIEDQINSDHLQSNYVFDLE